MADQSNIEHYFVPGWDEMHNCCKSLAWRLAKEPAFGSWKTVVPVTRGGLFPAMIIARELEILCIENLCVQTRREHVEQGKMNIIKSISAEMMEKHPGGRGMLVVEDLTDTGVTCEYIRQILPEAFIVVIFVKPGGKRTVNMFHAEVTQDTWIRFPWDTEIPSELALPIIQQLNGS